MEAGGSKWKQVVANFHLLPPLILLYINQLSHIMAAVEAKFKKTLGAFHC